METQTGPDTELSRLYQRRLQASLNMPVFLRIFVTGFVKGTFFAHKKLTHFLTLRLHNFLIIVCNCLKFSISKATVSGYILVLNQCKE